MSPTFTLEIADQNLLSEMAPLLREHWLEIAHSHDIPLEPDYATYLELQSQGKLKVFVARSASCELIGYAVYYVTHNFHYSSSLQAQQDVLFVRKECRKGSVGTRLIRFADEALRKMGVQVVLQHVKVAHNFGPLLERMGYEAVDIIYRKRLD